MTDILAKICADTLQHITTQKAHISEAVLLERTKEVTPPRGFRSALQGKVAKQQTALIAEVKKASPSKGIIRADFNHVEIATSYERAGAACISVLTDTPYFQGKDSYLVEVRGAVSLPVLRKDFMLDPYQIVESRSLGADCILLIMAALEDNQARELEQVAHSLEMDVLVEVHNREELERALRLESQLLGINNRNLKTMEISLTVTEELSQAVPEDYTLVCESGIHSHDDIMRIQKAGIYSFLVGESLMRQDNIKEATKHLLQG